MRSFGISCALLLLAGAAFGEELSWRDDYGIAYREAQEAKRLLVVSFYGPDARYEPDASAAALLQANVPVALAMDATIEQGGKNVKVLESGAFNQLKGAPGLAVINLKYAGNKLGHVVATLPLAEAQRPAKVQQVLEETARRFGEKVMTDPFGLAWHTEYNAAYNAAKSAKKLLFIAIDSAENRFAPDLELADSLRDSVLLRLRLEESAELLGHIGMRTFHYGSGVGVLDLKHEGSTYGRVTHTIPSRLLTKAGVHSMLALADRRSKDAQPIQWHNDYLEARRLAEKEHKMMLVAIDSAGEAFQPSEQSLPLLHGYVCARQTIDASYACRQGVARRLLDFLDFRQLREKPGIAVYDFTDESKSYYGKVVSVMPYKYLGPNPGNRVFSEAERAQELLLLEPETLTRRTLTWAIRVSKGHGE
ncbi:MAG: hypothetical protein U1E05_25605, partial [Patescibacteria group bacterium]|nr:hypothetical protein [Patescibacteria group bacterium]